MDDVRYTTGVCASGLSTYVVSIVLSLGLNIRLSERYLWYLTNFELRTPCSEYVPIYHVLPSRSSIDVP